MSLRWDGLVAAVSVVLGCSRLDSATRPLIVATNPPRVRYSQPVLLHQGNAPVVIRSSTPAGSRTSPKPASRTSAGALSRHGPPGLGRLEARQPRFPGVRG